MNGGTAVKYESIHRPKSALIHLFFCFVLWWYLAPSDCCFSHSHYMWLERRTSKII